MKHLIFVTLFIFWGYDRLLAQPKVDGNSEFSFAYNYDIHNPNDFFYLIYHNKGKKKKIKITLPEADKGYVINGKPVFITPYVVKVPVISRTDLLLGKYYNNSCNLFVPTPEGGYFIKNKDAFMGYLFTHVSSNKCCFYSSLNIWDEKGNLLNWEVRHTHTNYLLALNKDEDKDSLIIISNTCEILPYKIPLKNYTIKFGSGNMGYFSNGNFYFINTKKSTQQLFTSLDTKLFASWGNKNYSLDSFVDKSGFVPVKIGENSWGFLNGDGTIVSEAIEAEVLYPLIFSSSYAPVQNKGKWGVVDKTGKLIHPYTFEIFKATEEFIGFIKNDSLFWVNSDGSLKKELVKDYLEKRKREEEYSKNKQKYNEKDPSSLSRTYCVSFIMQNSSGRIYLYMVTVEDRTGNASEATIINAARQEKNIRNWAGYREINVLIDRYDCIKTKQMVDEKGVFRYDYFQIDSKTID